jgi:hypothetical protein
MTADAIRPGAPGVESIEFRILNIAANGPVVMTERVDVVKLPNKTFELQVMGTFEVGDGKIKAWRDYFDQNQFTPVLQGSGGIPFSFALRNQGHDSSGGEGVSDADSDFYRKMHATSCRNVRVPREACFVSFGSGCRTA